MQRLLPSKRYWLPDRAPHCLHSSDLGAKYRGSFNTLVFGKTKLFIGSRHDGRLDLVYHQNPDLNAGQPIALWTIQ
jgi:hypothetical protein